MKLLKKRGGEPLLCGCVQWQSLFTCSSTGQQCLDLYLCTFQERKI